MANYPSDGVNHRRQRRSSTPSANRYLPDLEARSSSRSDAPPGVGAAAGRGVHSGPRSAAQRSRDMGSKMYGLFQRAATADGADKSGLTALTYPVMANFAVDSAMAVALANTLFFAAASGESKSKVALYLIITIAPFAVIAPLIGPALDRLQHGRRLALAMSFALRSALVVVLIANYDGETGSFPSWVLYPCALGMMVLSKSFSVLRSAVTPRVLPPTIDLVRVNSRLTVFGLLGGTIAGGAVAAAAEYLFNLLHMPGALYVCIAVTVAGAVLAMRIPKWVEVTEGEVPTTLSYHGRSGELRRHPQRFSEAGGARQPLGRNIITALWGNCTIKVMVGFLFLYPGVRCEVAREERLGAAVDSRPDRCGGGHRQFRRQLRQRPAAAGSSGAVGRAQHRRGHRGCTGHRTDGKAVGGGACGVGDIGRECDREGLTGRVAARRSARGVARVGVRTVGIAPAAGLGGGRRDGGARVYPTAYWLYGDLDHADTRARADACQLSRRLPDPRTRRQPPGRRGAGGCAREERKRQGLDGAAGVKRGLAVLVAVAVLASVATGVLIWRLTRSPAPEHPEISAYTRGQLVRVGPYQFCNVLNPTECETPRSDGELAVDARNAVQLSVPQAIARAPWVLVRSYEGADVVDEFRSSSTLAVTIPTMDPHRGRLFGFAVQLPTLVRDEAGNEFPWTHAEWSVRTTWP